MWRRFGLLCFLLGAPLSSAANLKMLVTKEADATTSSGSAAVSGTVTAASAATSSSSSLASANGGWHMKAVTSVQARVQGDAPVWNEEAQMWLSKYGDTTELAYMNNLDTVNTASVEGALMYVQAEGINVEEQSVKCHRKNDMQYVVFYEVKIVQPTYGIKYYESHAPPEYGEFVAMDGAKCTDEGSDLSEDCKVYYGLDGEMDIGPMVGSNLQTSDPRAPYPGNYWFSYPNSCAQKLRADKTDECRAEYPGGLCAMGVEPDGDSCTFSYKILGYINIDDLVGITEMGYSNYTEFCEDGGVEFKASNTGSGFEVEESLDFWKKPGDEDANSERTDAMVKMYNELASNGTSANMSPLPEISTLTSSNPKCYEKNNKETEEEEKGKENGYFFPLTFSVFLLSSLLFSKKIMESDGGGGGGVVPIPSHTGLSPPHDDDHPDFSPVGSPESQPSDQLSATLLTDDLRNKIVKQVEYYFSDENLPTDKFLLKYVTRDKEGFVPVKVLASFRKVKKLTKETSVIAAALRESSLLVVSPDGRKVKRLHPLPLSEIKDPKVCTVLVENLPEDHSVDNLRCIFGQAGNVKHITIRDPHTERDPRKCTTAEKLLSGKLHAVVEYYSVEAAEKAVSILNDEQDWRFGLRVKLLKKTNKPGQSKKCWRDQDSDRNNNIQASDLAGNEENHSSEHPVDSQDEEEGDHPSKETTGEHAQKEKNGPRVPARNRGRGRRNKRGTNGHGHGTTTSTHGVEPSKPPPGPKMPDGTRGFAVGRGRPLSSSPS